KLSLKQAIDFINEAWEDVSATTINNCWKAIKILPENSEPSESELGGTELGE
ncbi:17008_t:CDS:1, partial [Cetraspora pellucida]